LRKLLGSLPGRSPISYSEHVRGGGQDVFEAMCRKRGEGIVSKKAGSVYRGRRTPSWLKIKCTKRQEFVIGGFTPSDKRGRPFASLLIGTFENDEFRYRGRVGTGFSEATLDNLQRMLESRRRKTSPFAAVPRSAARDARWVRPDIIAEIDFTELTDGGHVRHGVFKGLREDKEAGQVTLERTPGADRKTREEVHGIRISNPHRIVYPKQGITKVDLAHYYDVVATRMLPHVVNRPLSLLRCPKGRGDECFFQKHASAGFPDSLMHVNVREKSGKRADYLYVDGIEGVVAAVQMGTLEFHVWGSRIDTLEKPDRVVFDLDPDETLDFGVVRLAAAVLRRRLERLGLKTVPLVTGGKGVHVIAPLRRTAEWTRVKAFAKAFATKLATDEPDVFTATMSKSRRRGRIFVDWLRNERGSTAIAPYSTRARENGPVATPVGWRELEDLESANCFRIDDVIKRMQRKDPWDKSKSWRQSITAKLLETVSAD
jgi:bifunctional non-homologous end joining protein LigD